MTTPTMTIAEAKCATWEHIDTVRRMLRLLADEILRRGETHDRSKLESPEAEMFAEFTPKLAGLTFGSDEYKACLAAMAPTLRHHYENNRHHPEHFGDAGVSGMTLIDLLEMWADWWASSQRHADGNFDRSIDIGADRFKLNPQLVAIFKNTAAEMPSRIPLRRTQKERPFNRSAFERGVLDATQDGFENAPFNCIGGLDCRIAPKIPGWVPTADRGEWLRGYLNTCAEAYGDDWQTCEFGWAPGITIGGKEP
jgi:hypothetical protein